MLGTLLLYEKQKCSAPAFTDGKNEGLGTVDPLLVGRLMAYLKIKFNFF